MLKIAHRGYAKNYKENTVLAFEDAIHNNFDVIEIDIQLDKNNKIIVFHDTHINFQLVNTLSYEEIIQSIPDVMLLSTFFEKIDYQMIQIYLDLKGSTKLAEILHIFIIENNINIEKIWFASFNMQHLDILSKNNQCYQLGFISDNNFTLDILLHIVSKYNIYFVCFHWCILNKESISMLHSKGIRVFYYTLKDEKMLTMLDKFEIDGIISDISF